MGPRPAPRCSAVPTGLDCSLSNLPSAEALGLVQPSLRDWTVRTVSPHLSMNPLRPLGGETGDEGAGRRGPRPRLPLRQRADGPDGAVDDLVGTIHAVFVHRAYDAVGVDNPAAGTIDRFI